MIRVEEELQDVALTYTLVFVLCDSVFKHHDCLAYHPVDEESPCGFVSCQSFIVPVPIEYHHLVEERLLIGEAFKIPQLIKVTSPDGIGISCTLDTSELGRVPTHQCCHLIKSFSMRICKFLLNIYILLSSLVFLVN